MTASPEVSIPPLTASTPPPPPLSSIDAAAAPAVVLRPGRPDDAAACGRICHDAFHRIATAHAFPPDFPDVAAGVGFFEMALSQPEIYVVVAEQDGRVVGSNMLWEHNAIAGVGPITVDPEVQNGTIGRTLMADVLRRGETRGVRGIRLVQAGYHNRSLALYTKLGFDSREMLSVLQGPAIGATVPDRTVRPATQADVAACGALHERLHGFSRAGDLPGAIAQGTAAVVEHRGAITGYTTQIGFFGHAVGESNADLKALIAAAGAYAGPGFLLPTRNGPLLRWCLDNGLRMVQQLTLMTRGYYRNPKGAWLPSILY